MMVGGIETRFMVGTVPQLQMIIWERNVRDHPRGKRGLRLLTSTVPAETEKVRIVLQGRFNQVL